MVDSKNSWKAWLYLSPAILLLLVFTKDKVLLTLSLIGIATTLFVFLMLRNDLSIIGKVLYKITNNERFTLWFGKSTRFGWLGPVATQCGSFCLLWYGKKVIDKNKETLKDSIVVFYSMVYRISLVLFFVLPLYCVATDFIRIIRGVLLLYYIAIAIAFYNAKSTDKLILAFGMILFVLLFNVQGDRGILFKNAYWNIFFDKNSFIWLR